MDTLGRLGVLTCDVVFLKENLVNLLEKNCNASESSQSICFEEIVACVFCLFVCLFLHLLFVFFCSVYPFDILRVDQNETI